MPKAKKLEPQAAAAAHIDDEVIPAAKPVHSVDHVDIIAEDGHLVRTYSVADHGVDFHRLADSYIAGHPKCHKA